MSERATEQAKALAGTSARQPADQRDLERRLLRAAGQAISDFDLIADGDRILVGLSGGKDSYALLAVLLLLQQRAPVDFELVAANVHPGYPGFDPSSIAAFCADRGIRFHQLEAPIFELVQEKLTPGETPCALCARIRRGCLYTLARKEGYGKLALGHHLDDLVETLLLNMLYAGALRAMPAHLRRDEPPNVIRPLCYALEAEIASYARLVAFPVIPCASSTCGEDDQRRQVIKQLLSTLEADHPDIKQHARRALRNVDVSFLLDKRLLSANQRPSGETT